MEKKCCFCFCFVMLIQTVNAQGGIPLDFCLDNTLVCQNGGTCVGTVCSCSTGFTGTNCEININDCTPTSCQNGGTCIDGVNSFTCDCVPGYTGTECEIDINDCTPTSCQNGGTCIDGVNSFTCDCVPGYTGTECEIDINDCTPTSCQNGGTCIDGVNSFTCDCVPGYTGTECEIDIDDCATVSCQNGGTCIDGVNSFTCDCIPGYTGQLCEINIEDCTPTLCQNDGTCNDGVNEFTCQCTSNFTGTVCETRICPDGSNTVTCESVDSEFVKCRAAERNAKIIHVNVINILSSSVCEFFDGERDEYVGTEAVYGYDKNFIWVDNGCQGEFEACLSAIPCDSSSEDSCNSDADYDELESGDSSEETAQEPGSLRQIQVIQRFLVEANFDFSDILVQETQSKNVLKKLKTAYKKLMKSAFKAIKNMKLKQGSLIVEYTIEIDNSTSSVDEATRAILKLTIGGETVEILGQVVSATSLTLDGFSVTATTTEDSLCQIYNTVVGECPSGQTCVVKDSLPSCRSTDEDSDGIQKKLLYLLIGLCVGSVVIIVILVITVALVRWNRRNKGAYKVKPRDEPVRIAVEEKAPV